ncbi:MAG: hypothetical protein SWX82_11805 [Cyanobacteriota bacterium]|nr:hypothetical protein [Cyanobacteriota bacterium]
MKSSLSIPLKLLLITLATLSQFFFANSASVQGRGLVYIENLSEEKEDVERELQKQETTLKKLESAERSARKLFLNYESFQEVPNSKSFDYVGNCAPANGTGKYESVSCREKLLRKMCETELKLETFNYSLTFCQKYFDLVISNQSLYSQRTQVESSEQMCLVLPFHVDRYQHLDNNSLEKVLLACQQGLLKVNPQFGYSYGGNVLLLRNLKEIYLVLEDYSGAKDFFTNIINIAKKKDKQTNRQSLEQGVSWNTINTIYPALNFLGDIYFATQDKAMNLYLEADSIYTKYINYQDSNYPRFLIDTSATSDLVSANLKSVANGFSLTFTYTNGSKYKLHLDQNLALVGRSSYHKKTQWSRLFVTNYEKTTANIKIEPDGSFDASMLITLRHYCVMKGKLEFIGDAADKLPQN